MNRRFFIGLMCAAVAAALVGEPAAGNTSTPTMAVFGKAGSKKPRWSQWLGADWSTPAYLTDVGEELNYAVARVCPTRNEILAVFQDKDKDVNVVTYNGSTWSGTTQICNDVGQIDDRPMDAAYEQKSGDGLIVYWGQSAKKICYRTYNGTSLSAETQVSIAGVTMQEGEYITLYPKPKSDEITLIYLGKIDDKSMLYTMTWNGSSWGSWTQLSAETNTKTEECYSMAYPSTMDTPIVVYNSKSVGNLCAMRTWDGVSWSAETTIPALGTKWSRWVRLEADPDSSLLVLGSLDDNFDIYANVYDSDTSTWGTPQLCTTNLNYKDRRQFDVAFERGGQRALFAYAEKDQKYVRYRIWDGETWSAQNLGPNLGNKLYTVQARTGASPGEVLLATNDDGHDIEFLRWDGATMSGFTKTSGDIGGDDHAEPFMITASDTAVPVPANIPYSTTFASGMGAEWAPVANGTNGTLGAFAGTFGRGGCSLALNTTIGESYSLLFDIYAFDSWTGTPRPLGPDYFNVVVTHTRMMHATLCPTGSYTASYLYSPNQTGSYGYNSGTDGVYRRVNIVFTATKAVTYISFLGEFYGSDSFTSGEDEKWGLDNVSVKLTPYLNVTTAKGFGARTSDNDDKGSGWHWGDLDNDGDLDAIATGNNDSRLFINNSSGSSFTVSQFGGGRCERQGALGDFDNDGDLDFWCSTVNDDNTETLFRNDGSANFTNYGNAGLSGPDHTEGCVVADVNTDGLLDVLMFSQDHNYLGLNTIWTTTTLGLSETTATSYGFNGAGSYGDGDYVSSADVNTDGYPDFFYHYGGGKLFLSNGDGTYTQNNRNISIATDQNKRVGSCWGDYDNDGDMDLFVARYDANQPCYLWRNDGTSFTNVASTANLYNFYGQRGCAWGDYNNDGYLDLYVANRSGGNTLYYNVGDGTFSPVNEGATITGNTHDVSFVDFDNDGDLDIAISRDNADTVLLQNRMNTSNYLNVRFVGRGGKQTVNKSAVGVRVELYASNGTTLLARRDVGGARGYGGDAPLWLHFGGIDPNSTYKVRTYWKSFAMDGPSTATVVPAGASTTIGSTTNSQMLTITEPKRPRVIRWLERINKAS